jgi:hypothetical protein
MTPYNRRKPVLSGQTKTSALPSTNDTEEAWLAAVIKKKILRTHPGGGEQFTILSWCSSIKWLQETGRTAHSLVEADLG